MDAAASGDLRAGLRDSVPIAVGYLTVALAFGLFCAQAGIPTLAATVVSLTNLSSSGQFAGATVWAAGGTLLELALAVALVNLRYVLMAVSLGQRLQTEGQARPLYLLRFADRRHGWVLGANSLFGGGLASVGVPLAWQRSTNLWGFASVPLTALMDEPEAVIVYIEPLPFPALTSLRGNQLWRRLPAVGEGRVVGLPSVWLGNGLPSLIAFSRLLAERWPQAARNPDQQSAGGLSDEPAH